MSQINNLWNVFNWLNLTMLIYWLLQKKRKEKEKFVHFVVTDSAKADSCTLCVTLPLGLMCPVNVWDFAVLITIPGHRSIIFGSVSYVCKKPSSVSLLEKTPTSASGITDKETYCSCWAKCRLHIRVETPFFINCKHLIGSIIHFPPSKKKSNKLIKF